MDTRPQARGGQAGDRILGPDQLCDSGGSLCRTPPQGRAGGLCTGGHNSGQTLVGCCLGGGVLREKSPTPSQREGQPAPPVCPGLGRGPISSW